MSWEIFIHVLCNGETRGVTHQLFLQNSYGEANISIYLQEA
jgi:hypothetical protein